MQRNKFSDYQCLNLYYRFTPVCFMERHSDPLMIRTHQTADDVAQIAAWASANESPNRVRAEEWHPRADHQRWIAFAATMDLKRERRLEKARKDFEAAKTSASASASASSSASASAAASSSSASIVAKPPRLAAAAAAAVISPAVAVLRANTHDSSAAAAFIAVREVWHSALVAFAVRAAQAVDAVRRRAFETAAEMLMTTTKKAKAITQSTTTKNATTTMSKAVKKSDQSSSSASSLDAAVVASLSAADQSVAIALQHVLAAVAAAANPHMKSNSRSSDKSNDNDTAVEEDASAAAADWTSTMAELEARVLAPRAVVFYAWHSNQFGTRSKITKSIQIQKEFPISLSLVSIHH